MKAITATDRAIDKAIVDAIKTFLATYNQTKLAADTGTWNWAKAERHFVRRAIAKNRRGATGFGGDISNVGQVP
jgi:hypothetical protein